MSLRPRHLFHVFPSFGIGGVPLRIARIINYLDRSCRHTIVSLDGSIASTSRLNSDLAIEMVAPPRHAATLPARLLNYHRLINRHHPDLLLTYNWGSIEWAAANRLFPVCRHIHFESGFGIEEASRQLTRRVIARRWALARCSQIVVPSMSLKQTALQVWRLPAKKVLHIPNGIDVRRFTNVGPSARRALPDALGPLIGILAPLRPEKNVARLMRVFSMLPRDASCGLVVAGDGGEKEHLVRLSEELGIAPRMTFLGQSDAPERLLRSLDIFSLSSDTEQMPNAVLEAMATALPIVAVDVGDIKSMVAPENRAFIVPREDLQSFVAALTALIGAPHKRLALGQRNRERTLSHFAEDRMFRSFETILMH